VGRASNRKKARRQAPRASRPAGPGSRAEAVSGQISLRNGVSAPWPGRSGNPAPGLFGDRPQNLFGDGHPDAATRQALLQIATGLGAMTDKWKEHEERVSAARRAWCGGAEPVPAEVPSWPEDSLGGRFLAGFHLKEARNAPSLLTADLPDAAMIRAEPAHWNVAADALVRAVAFDGLRVDHPAVSALLDVLAPVAEAELAYGEVIESPLHQGWREADRDGPSFPEDDGPVLLIGAFALVDATLALVGTDSLGAVFPALRSAAEEALPGVDGGAVADALVGALSRHYVCEQPGDAEILERIGRDVPGNALEQLVGTGVVPFGETLRVGLSLLSALTMLCMNGSASILAGSPEHGPA
jgi:hypothetical protein